MMSSLIALLHCHSILSIKSYEGVSHPVLPTTLLSDRLIENALARIFEFGFDLIICNMLAKFFNLARSYFRVATFDFNCCSLRNLITCVGKRFCFQGRTPGKKNTLHLQDPWIEKQLV